MNPSPDIPAEIAPGAIPSQRPRAVPLGGVLCEPSGQVSSMRVAFLFALLVVLLVWMILSLRANEMLDIPPHILAGLAALAGAKAVQRFAEGGGPKR